MTDSKMILMDGTEVSLKQFRIYDNKVFGTAYEDCRCELDGRIWSAKWADATYDGVTFKRGAFALNLLMVEPIKELIIADDITHVFAAKAIVKQPIVVPTGIMVIIITNHCTIVNTELFIGVDSAILQIISDERL